MVRRRKKVTLKTTLRYWNTEYKSETYKYTVKMIAKIYEWVSYGRFWICCICPNRAGRSWQSFVCERISRKQSFIFFLKLCFGRFLILRDMQFHISAPILKMICLVYRVIFKVVAYGRWSLSLINIGINIIRIKNQTEPKDMLPFSSKCEVMKDISYKKRPIHII